MSSQPLPTLPEDATPEWLTFALSETATLQGGRVIAAEWERVGRNTASRASSAESGFAMRARSETRLRR